MLHIAPVVGPVLQSMTDELGRGLWNGIVPPSLSGTTVHLQAFVAEAQAPAGFAGTNGLALTLP